MSVEVPEIKEAEPVFYTQRPDGTSLWLPPSMMDLLGIDRGARLTAKQYSDERLQALLAERLNLQASRRGGRG